MKAVNSFFTVRAGDDVRTCRARGVFRKRGTQVFVGDWVDYEEVGTTEGVITEVLPRKTELIRPPIANVDQAILVCSSEHPSFQPGLLDRTLVSVLHAGLDPVIVMNKADLVSEADMSRMTRPYAMAGYTLLVVSATSGLGLPLLHERLRGRISVFVGASGVGKSSLVNTFSPELAIKMGEISEKLGRGKHTTTHVELFEIDQNTFVADAPGFSQLDVGVMPEEVRHFFWEFGVPANDCAYRTCLHRDEQDCAVKRSVGPVVSQERYQSYLSILAECKEREERRY